MSEQIEKIKIAKTELELLTKMTDMIVDDITINPFSYYEFGDCLSCRVMDASHVSLLEIVLKNAPLKTRFAFRTHDLKEIVSSFDSDMINFQIIPDEKLILSDTNQKNELRLIESTDGKTPLPKIDYNTIITVSIKEFYKVMSEFNKQSFDYIEFSKQQNSPLMINSKSDHGQFSKSVKIQNVLNDGFSCQIYGLEYIMPYLRILNTNKDTKNMDLKISFSDQKPIKFSIDNYVNRCDFYLAPRIEN